jgi:hypothetical protein
VAKDLSAGDTCALERKRHRVPGDSTFPVGTEGQCSDTMRTKRAVRTPAGSARFRERHSVANLVNLDRQDFVRTGAFGTIQPHAVLLVEATSPAALSAHPEREGTLTGCTSALDRRIHQGASHARSRNLFRDVDAPEFGGLRGDIDVGARQHVRVADDTTSHLRDEDGRAGRKLGEPFGEVGGGLLHRQGFQVRLRQEIAVAPAPRGHAHFRDGSGIVRSCLTNDKFASHERSVASGMPLALGSRFPPKRTSSFGSAAVTSLS